MPSRVLSDAWVSVVFGIVFLSLATGYSRHGLSQMIIVSKETTYFVGPLDGRGGVDYSAALHETLSKGVTPGDNAAVDVVKSLGPDESPGAKTFYERLGIAPLPKHGEYLVGWDEFLKTKTAAAQKSDRPLDQLKEQYRLAMSRPWSQQEFPLVAEWVRANEKPLATLVAGVEKPRFYMPHGSTDWLLVAMLPWVQKARDAGRLLSARAMLKLNEGQIDEAFDDLLVCRRFGRLIGQDGGFATKRLVGIALEGLTTPAFAALADGGRLTSKRAITFQERLDSLPDAKPVADVIDLSERCMCLDTIKIGSRVGMRPLLTKFIKLGSSDEQRKLDWLSRCIDDSSQLPVDWNETSRVCNAWFDRVVEAMHLPTHAQRSQELGRIDSEIDDLRRTLREGQTTDKVPGRRMAHILLALIGPKAMPLEIAETRKQANVELTRLVLMLAAYRADHKTYPDKLEALVPHYVSSVPKDPYTGRELAYRRTARGYRLYSVGPNGKDDGGAEYGATERVGADDVGVVVPPAGL